MVEGALVLEGGSLRCQFTAGVLDVFLEEGILFSYVAGVSAGSMCAMSYISGQAGRTRDINQRFLHDKRYLSFKNMVKNRQVFNFDFVFGELSRTLVPFDWEAFNASPQRFVAVATRCRTGRPAYFEKGICGDMAAAVAASSSMPLLSRMITVEGKKYLDGGLSMPIPYERAMEEGYEKVVLVLSRDKDYRKPPLGRLTRLAYDRYFGPLKELRESIYQIPDRYNRMQEEIGRLEAEGRIFVIRPGRPVTVSRLERDERKLEALYQEGREMGKERLLELRRYLGVGGDESRPRRNSEGSPCGPGGLLA